MTDGTDAGEVARLDDVIAENDAREGSDARWRAASAVYNKARLIEAVEGDDAALPLYMDVVQRLADCEEDQARELLIHAMNDVAVIHYTQGRGGESRSVASALVEEHFDDPPPAAIESLVNGTLLLAHLLDKEGEVDRALALYEQLIERYAQPGVRHYRYTSAAASCGVAATLLEAGRLEESLKRVKGVIRDLGDPSDPVLQQVLAGALVGKATVLNDMGFAEDCNAVCEEIVARFKSTEDPGIAKHVAWAQMVLDDFPIRQPSRHLNWRALMRSSAPDRVASDAVGFRTAQAWYALGYELHGRVGRAEEAERAYRNAIDAGYSDAWLSLGNLLSAVRGREADEEYAYRMALGSEDPAVAAGAALMLGNIADRLHGDLQSARSWFEMAAQRGSGFVAHHATLNLGFLAAYQGDRAAAREHLLAATVAIGASRDLDTEGLGRANAAVFVALAAGRLTRRTWRWYRQAVYRASRRTRALRKSSRLARWIADAVERATTT